MSVTETYTRIHAALGSAADGAGLTGFDVRVLVALREHGGSLKTDELEATLDIDGSAIRRALLKLYDCHCATGVASDDGGPRRQGVRSLVKLTPRGDRIAAKVHREVRA